MLVSSCDHPSAQSGANQNRKDHKGRIARVLDDIDSPSSGVVSGGDTIFGGTENDLIYGQGGVDTIQGNAVGTNVNGDPGLGNNFSGIQIEGSSNNVVGGTGAGAGNLVVQNSESAPAAGIFVVDSGKTSSPPPTTGNTIRENSIHDNNMGIDLLPRNYSFWPLPDGVTANDSGDADTGPNNLQNYPVLTAATSDGSSTTLQGSLNSASTRDYRLEFFDNAVAGPSYPVDGYGQGAVYLGSDTVTTGSTGDVNFSEQWPTAIPPGHCISATATDTTTGDTSEFSNCQTVVQAVSFDIWTLDPANPSTTQQLLVNNGTTEPTAALIKVLLINGAVELVGQYNPSEAGRSPNSHSGCSL